MGEAFCRKWCMIFKMCYQKLIFKHDFQCWSEKLQKLINVWHRKSRICEEFCSKIDKCPPMLIRYSKGHINDIYQHVHRCGKFCWANHLWKDYCIRIDISTFDFRYELLSTPSDDSAIILLFDIVYLSYHICLSWFSCPNPHPSLEVTLCFFVRVRGKHLIGPF